MRKSIEERFMSHVRKEDGCWIWTGHIHASGYGRFNADGKVKNAHRWIYEHLNGKLPTGLYACHSCDVRSCVKPGHLFAGTRQENMSDMVKKGRSSRGEKRNNHKLTDRDVMDIRAGNLSVTEVSKKYGIAHSRASNILAGKGWKHVS